MNYLDNAATSFPKPPSVTRELLRAVNEYGGNPGRGSHPLAMRAAETIYNCREALASFFGARSPERVVFTLSATHALNLAIKGFFEEGGHVLLSELEHNATRRPIHRLCEEKKLSFDLFPVLDLDPEAIVQGIEGRIRPNTRAVICTHGSNICSITLPIAKIGALCRQRSLALIVDAAQTAGHIPIHMEDMGIDALALPGHKGLYGIQGCGALLLSERFSPRPLWEGGTGIESLAEGMPLSPPERYEAGTLPTPAIATLWAGLRSFDHISLGEIHLHEKRLFRLARDRLESLGNIQIYAPEHEGAVLLFNKNGLPPAEIAHRLAKQGICVRAGLHCAPLAHQALGTPEEGAVRISFGRYNTPEEIDHLWRALRAP